MDTIGYFERSISEFTRLSLGVIVEKRLHMYVHSRQEYQHTREVSDHSVSYPATWTLFCVRYIVLT